MRAEDIKEWLRGMENAEKAAKKGESGCKGEGDRKRLLLKLCQHVWETGEIPWQMLLTIVVSEIELHDYLHGFRAKRGCVTGIMKATLHQQLAAREPQN